MGVVALERNPVRKNTLGGNVTWLRFGLKWKKYCALSSPHLWRENNWGWYVSRGGVEDTRLEAKAKDKKNPRPRPRTEMIEAKDQGHKCKCFPKKKCIYAVHSLLCVSDLISALISWLFLHQRTWDFGSRSLFPDIICIVGPIYD